jgi:hypothetical protein
MQNYPPGFLTNGVYTITVTGVDYPVYCDFTSDGGGWTLVGSSVFKPLEVRLTPISLSDIAALELLVCAAVGRSMCRVAAVCVRTARRATTPTWRR